MRKAGRYILVYDMFEDRFDEQPSTSAYYSREVALECMGFITGKAYVIDSETGEIIGHKTTYRALVGGEAVDDE